MNKVFYIIVTTLILLTHACQISPPVNSTVSRFLPTATQQTKIAFTMKHLFEWEMEKVNQVKWSSESTKLYVAGKETGGSTGIYVFDAIKNTRLWFKASETATKITISPDGETGVVYGDRLEFWDLEGGNKIGEYGGNTYKDIQFFDKDRIIIGESQTLRSGPYTTEVSVMNIGTKERKRLFDIDGWIRKVSINQDQQRLLISVGRRNHVSSDAVIIWSIKELKIICEFPGFDGAFIANLGSVVISDWKGISFGELNSCKLHELTNENIYPYSMDVDTKGRWLAFTNNTTKEVEVWDLEKRGKIYTLQGYLGNVLFSRDGKKLLIENAGGSRPTKLSVWEIEE